ASEFPPVSTAEWEATIQADLKGADYEKRLVWKTDEGIAVRPYYRAEDAPAAALAPGQFPFTRGVAQAWEIVEDPSIPAGAVNASRFHENGAASVEELAFALSEGVERLAAAEDPGFEAASLVFVFATGSNYFFEIAKLRAARMLWAQAVTAFKVTAPEAARMRIHARTALANKSIYDPYTNLLRATTEALSAVIGGCDSLTVMPARFPERLARNVQLILKEECHLDGVADPAGGSYYVEALTDAIAREAWKLFQQVEERGGFAAAEGFVAERLAASRAEKEKALATRRRVLVGVNNYPDLGERVLSDATDLAQAGWRMARAFEEIRLRTERHAAAAGRTPRVLLLKRGDLKMRMARATFCQNFFGCAGFEIAESVELDPAADLIVLCSSDAEYLELARDVVPRTSVPVIVAGNPKEQIAELRAAGVAGFVHVLSNQIETLTEWQDKVGVKH
ncbi:MAG: methylmalonyl-CoA mutase small subunit, partial [Anaerolinea sp.]|nr:methylmalonyl-CoA mutase small subunit [Anaerolinea sp.]